MNLIVIEEHQAGDLVFTQRYYLYTLLKATLACVIIPIAKVLLYGGKSVWVRRQRWILLGGRGVEFLSKRNNSELSSRDSGKRGGNGLGWQRTRGGNWSEGYDRWRRQTQYKATKAGGNGVGKLMAATKMLRGSRFSLVQMRIEEGKLGQLHWDTNCGLIYMWAVYNVICE